MESQERFFYFKNAIGAGFIGAFCTGILYVLLERSNLLESSPFHLMGGIYSFLKIYIPSFLGSYFSLRTWRWGEIERNGRKEYSVWLSTIMGTLFGYLIFFILFLLFLSKTASIPSYTPQLFVAITANKRNSPLSTGLQT